MRKTHSAENGFSRLELLAILGILFLLLGSVVALLNPFHALDKARDNEREQDFTAIQTGLKSYYTDHSNYPRSLLFGQKLSDSIVYLPQIPQDPSCDSNNCVAAYQYITDGSITPQWYILYGKLSAASKDQATQRQFSCAALPCGAAGVPPGYDMCAFAGTLDCAEVKRVITGQEPNEPISIPTPTGIPAGMAESLPNAQGGHIQQVLPVYDRSSTMYFYSNGSAGRKWEYNWQQQITDSPNRLLVAFMKSNWSYNDAFTYSNNAGGDSRSFTKLAEVHVDPWYYSLWYLKNPEPGTANLSVRLTVPQNAVGGVSISSYSNVNQATPLGTPVTSGGALGSEQGITVPGTRDTQLIIDGVTHSGGPPTVGGAQTLTWTYSFTGNIAGGVNYLAGSSRQGALGSTTMVWTAPASSAWLQIAVPLNRAN